jgi:5-methyltetrahydropteroyltriglutamate--homocysteine methyltransferase
MTAVHRAEVIGSLLRPAALRDARRARHTGALSPQEFKRIEDGAVDGAIELQEAVGLEVVTDGEMRRGSFVGTLIEVIDGLEQVPAPPVRWHSPQADEDIRIANCVVGKIRRQRSLAAEEYTYARARTTRDIKVTLPSPMMLALFWSPEHSTAAYPGPFELFADAVDVLRQEVREPVALGCGYVQIDAPELATLVDGSQRAMYEARGVSPERMLGEGIELINAVADTPGVTYGLHLCRGNNAGRWMSEGGYDLIATQVFRRATAYDVLLLEYDDQRSGSFEPLAEVPADTVVVLGLVSTKSDALESAEGLEARIADASRFVAREQLALSTQCGFASVAQGNPITEESQTAKLQLVVDVARRVWT